MINQISSSRLWKLLSVGIVTACGLCFGFVLGRHYSQASEAPLASAMPRAMPNTSPTRANKTVAPPVKLARAPVAVTPTIAPLSANLISEEDLMAHVRYLGQKIGPHPAGSSGDERAVNYIQSQLESYGYAVEKQPFQTLQRGLLTWNAVASKPSRGGKLKLVVGAHHDTTPTSPGADDNATGVAVLLEVARQLAQQDSPFEVTFVAFGAEELQHDGSKAYVQRAKDKNQLPDGMINLDMVAVGKVFQIGSYNTDSWLMKHCANAADSVRELQSPAPFGGKSDYASFAAKGVPVAAFAWDPEDPNKHSPKDSLRHLTHESQQHMALTANVLLEALQTPPRVAFKAQGAAKRKKTR